MMRELRGAPVASCITEALSLRVSRLQEAGQVPTLAVVRMGNDTGGQAYERSIARQMKKLGIDLRSVVLAHEASVSASVAALDELAADPQIDAILPLRPLGPRENEITILEHIPQKKDVDGCTDANLGALFSGAALHPWPVYAPCTALACLSLLDFYAIPVAGAHVVVVGRSSVVGRPVAQLFLSRDATVTVCHRKTRDLSGVCRTADILVVACGSAKMIGASHIGKGATVLDVGMNIDENGLLCGDCDCDALVGCAAAYTPVPGGIGAVTTAILAEHVVSAAECALQKSV